MQSSGYVLSFPYVLSLKLLFKYICFHHRNEYIFIHFEFTCLRLIIIIGSF